MYIAAPTKDSALNTDISAVENSIGPNRRHVRVELGRKEENGEGHMVALQVCSWGPYEMTSGDFNTNVRGTWGDVLIDIVGTDQRNIAYCASTSYCGSGFMDYANYT